MTGVVNIQYWASQAGEVCSICKYPMEYQRDERDQTPWAPDPIVEMRKSAFRSPFLALGGFSLEAWKRSKSERAF
jgi:hypothetical protein